ncbi:MAG: HepT-like ribonuclease domain-containing protein [Anaerolineales bacterium]
MSPRNWQDRIRDILEAIAEIQKFTQDMDYEAFKKDDKSVRAVEMNFIIIGEAAGQIPEEIEEKYVAIPWSLMRAMRNRIVHVYFKVDEKLMWDTVQNDLPPLIPELEKLL